MPLTRSLAGLLALLAGAAMLGGTAAAADAAPRPVVLELFTSNSCSSCPPAYRLLGQLQSDNNDNVQLIRLDEHVDYWNQLSWVDRYSSHEYTARQQNYAREVFGPNKVYTPQLVVDGSREMVGSDGARVAAAIAQPASPAVQPIGLQAMPSNGKVAVRINLDGANLPQASRLWLAVTQDHVVSHVGAGENAGRTLTEDGVVRHLQPVATIAGSGSAGSGNTPPVYTQTLELPSGVSPADLHVVAFVQQQNDHHIVAAATEPLAGS